MKKLLMLFLLMLFAFTSTHSQQIEYPFTKKVDQIDDYHGTKISDPYRWLEDNNSKETAEWVEAQNKVTQEYLSKIPFREAL